MSKTNVFKRWPAALFAPALMAAMGVSPAFAQANCSPEAQISPANQTVDENEVVTMNGQPSKDETSYSWVQTAGPTVLLSSATAARPSFTAPSVGPAGATLKFALTVKGCSPVKTSAALETTITVLDVDVVAPNQPPLAASVVSPATIYTGDTVMLDGTGSTDPDGDDLTYSWEQLDGDSVTLTDANTAVATFTAPFAPFPNGTSLKFRLTVFDGSLTGTTDQIVNVIWQNVAPTASVSCPAYVDERAAFTLNGSGSTDPDDGIAAYAWTQTMGGPIAELPAILSTASINATAPSLTSPLDKMSFMLEVTDAGGLVDSAECDVIVNDITPPVATPTQSPAANFAGWNNTDVSVSWDWVDAGKGVDDNNCTQTSTSSGEGLGLNLTASCTDLAGNTADESYAVNVDKTAPAIAWNGSINDGDIFFFSFVPASPTCTAADTLSGVDGACTVTGYSTDVGTHTLTATATDVAGNKAEVTREYEVKAWTLKGFYQPVDMAGVWNTVKNGSTVPLKFEVFAGTTELTDVAVIDGFTVAGVACPGSGVAVDDIELTTTGGTALRYDSSGGQFIQNWQTPKKPGACYAVAMTTDDGSSISANFRLK